MKQAAGQELGPNHWADKTKEEEKLFFYFTFVLSQETKTHTLELSRDKYMNLGPNWICSWFTC